MKPLVVIPSFLRSEKHLKTLMDTLASIEHTVPGETDILVVDDHSPDQDLVDVLETATSGSLAMDTPSFELIRKKENSGFSTTVNFGLRKARDEGRDAVLMNADIEMDVPDWVTKCQETLDGDENPAAVVGALLVYPQTGLIQHAGIYFSFLTRRFYEKYKYAPARLPAALRRAELPVTGAFQYIRHKTLTDVGIYDERFRMGFEDVDYSLRVFEAGLHCVYNPQVRAYHFESMFRGEKSEQVTEWEIDSFKQLNLKYAGKSFAQFVPTEF